MLIVFILMFFAGNAWAQSASNPETVVTTFSDQMLTILKGPITKLLAALILLAGVGGLLRGRHQLAISCGVAFIILLFLPVLLEQMR